MGECTSSGLTDPGPIEFSAVLERTEQAGSSGYVQVPIDLKRTYGKVNLVPIRATFDGSVEYRGSLANMGGEHAVLIVRKDILAKLGKSPGDMIAVKLVIDTEPRTVDLDDDEQAGIDADAAARETWETLSYSHHREYHLWIEDAKKPETRERRISKMVEMLAQGKKLK
jgi:hypothetical protein